jgi:Vacuolar transporter chaperone
MMRRKAPAHYEDLAGPTVLALALMTAIVAQFGMKLYFLFD